MKLGRVIVKIFYLDIGGRPRKIESPIILTIQINPAPVPNLINNQIWVTVRNLLSVNAVLP